jgi:hypothetical protein
MDMEQKHTIAFLTAPPTLYKTVVVVVVVVDPK